MSDQPAPEAPEEVNQLAADDTPPVFDKVAARARYRKLMRSWPMRLMYALTAFAILAAWGLGIGSAFAPDVEKLQGHDITVSAAQCKTCHNSGLNKAPAYNHSYAPTCGFCHRQGLPIPSSRLNDVVR